VVTLRLVPEPVVGSVSGLPKLAPSTTNCTVPVGAIVPVAAETVAVKATLRPKTDGLAEEAIPVVVFVLPFTVSVVLPLTGGWKESPL
jgi:hypothetical protein